MRDLKDHAAWWYICQTETETSLMSESLKKDKGFFFLETFKCHNRNIWGKCFNLLIKRDITEDSGPSYYRLRNCGWQDRISKVKANRSLSQSLMNWSTDANNKTSWLPQRQACTLEERILCETQHNRRCVLHPNQYKEQKLQMNVFFLPPSSIMRPDILDPLCGRSPDAGLGLRHEKLLLRRFNYP